MAPFLDSNLFKNNRGWINEDKNTAKFRTFYRGENDQIFDFLDHPYARKRETKSLNPGESIPNARATRIYDAYAKCLLQKFIK